MARIQVFESGGIQPDAPTVTPFRAPDFGPGIGEGVARLGQGLGEAAQKVDEIQDLHAHIEANRLEIARNNLVIAYDKRVRSTMGEGAEAAADKGFEDLNGESDKLLASASPRARRILAPKFAELNANQGHEWWTYGFEQKKQAYDTSSQAANDKDLEAAGHTDSDAAAKPFLDSIATRNHQRATFFGLGSDWETAENLKAVSSYHKGRAEMIGVDSASNAIKYAIDNRGSMSDGDFASIVRTYRDAALDERAEVEALGYDKYNTDTPTTTNDDGQPVKTADPSSVFKGLILPNEGSKLVAHDSNGAPVKYGINQKANPDVDVANLTQAGAEKLFIDRYWKPSGADKLSPALAVVHADTYYLNKSEAMRILKASGGDVQKYMEMRDDFLARLHAENPAKYPDYSSRNQRVENYAAALGGDGTPFSFSGHITDKTNMGAVEDEVMARKDIPLALKTRILRVVRERREMLRQDKRSDEDDARDTLITATTGLGDNFTSIKQLPADALSRASPETIAALTKAAQTNRYKKNDNELKPYVAMVEMTDPKRFLSKDFDLELMRKGASPSFISAVETQRATVIKKNLNAKPDVVSSGELWKLAKPAFEAAGIDVEDHNLVKTAAGRQAAASRQQQATVFLHDLATEWANDNPGKKPSEEVMRQWIGAALLKTSAGSRLFEANDAQVYNSLPANVRNTIIRDLRRGGVTSTGNELVSDVASYYRKLRANYGTGPISLSTKGGVVARPLRGIDTVGDQLSQLPPIDTSDDGEQ